MGILQASLQHTQRGWREYWNVAQVWGVRHATETHENVGPPTPLQVQFDSLTKWERLSVKKADAFV